MRSKRVSMLHAGHSLADEGHVDAVAIEKIAQGLGVRDAIQDVIDLGSLFLGHWDALSNKAPFTREQIVEATVLATSLQNRVQPKNAPKRTQAEVAAAMDVRDRFYTLVRGRYETVRRVGAWLFGVDEMIDRVPPLLTHARTRHVSRQKPPTGDSAANTAPAAK